MNLQQLSPPTQDIDDTPECPDCNSTWFTVDTREQSFSYGRGREATLVTCLVPVYTCSNCHCEWTGHEAEAIRHEALCLKLNRLTPDQVLAIRERSGMSQAEFSRITGFGEASLSRWETGAQIQNTACDRMLRIIAADPKNLYRLQQIANTEAKAEGQFQVVTITPELKKRQRAFQLRGHADLLAS